MEMEFRIRIEKKKRFTLINSCIITLLSSYLQCLKSQG